MTGRRRWADLAATTALLAVYGLGGAGVAAQIAHEAATLEAGFGAELALTLLSQLATLAFLSVQMALFVIRRPAVGSAPGWAPKIAALAGLMSPLLLVLLPRAAASPVLTSLSLGLILVGTVASIYVVTALGRSFAILPQARGLVTGGPYRLVRHPLYLVEQVATFGVMLQYAQPWALLLAAAALAAQFPRMRYEEQVLSAAYPGYRAYMAMTRRLIPGLY